MHEEVDLARADASGPAKALDARSDLSRPAARCGGNLIDEYPSARLIDEDKIGERASDISGERDHVRPIRNPQGRVAAVCDSSQRHASGSPSGTLRQRLARIVLGKSLTERLSSCIGDANQAFSK
jgi:hypothetical protein